MDYLDCELTNWDKGNGLAPQLLAICEARLNMISRTVLEPGLPPIQTETLRGQAKELRLLLNMLNVNEVGRHLVAPQTQNPRGTES